MKFTLSYGDGTLIQVLLLKEFLQCEVGEWDSPYPNTVEDSSVYGLIEAWGQSDDWLGVLLQEKGAPDRVKIEEI
jgi:hypothetical protein